ncbi:MAG: putative zinc-binding peptidase [Labilithrix sp.]|nr:putative zinc-binding peptidase [Labilithrix sp.]MCW5815834.1 putative zinc-binding peptidase [Labilithrix sp.]
MKVFHCTHCAQLLFFENSVCVPCGRALGYLPEEGLLVSLERPAGAEGQNRWRSERTGRTYRLCDNYVKYNVCNWVVREDDPEALCRSCRLTKTIPNLGKAGNDRLWYKLEVAKRRLLYTFDRLGLPYRGRHEDPEHGLQFDFMEEALTGHAEGVITVNIQEADDAHRVKTRIEMQEPYRTLLGHFRHESGHYYWERLISTSPAIGSFRVLFGDERADYQDALKRNYGQGPPPNWQDEYVSSYAAMHPWEDWAETWAHYLHMVDTLETASACGVSIEPPRHDEPTLLEVPNPVGDADVSFEKLISSWATITYVLNNLNRGLGNDDAYPFVLSDTATKKLHFVHTTIAARSTRFAAG